MKCPSPYCGSTTLKVLVTREAEHEYSTPKKYQASNIVRRRRQCHRGHLFWTIELTELEYENLVTTAQHFDPGPTIRGPR